MLPCVNKQFVKSVASSLRHFLGACIEASTSRTLTVRQDWVYCYNSD